MIHLRKTPTKRVYRGGMRRYLVVCGRTLPPKLTTLNPQFVTCVYCRDTVRLNIQREEPA